jgi:fructose-bisphosphate aldolase class I
VPMVEPEVLMDGTHDIEVCYEVTEATLRSLFGALYEQNVMLEGTILKASMVISGKDCPSRPASMKWPKRTLRASRPRCRRSCRASCSSPAGRAMNSPPRT